MILQELYHLARQENLLEDPDYEPKAVPWVIDIGPGGRFLGFVRTQGQTSGEGEKKPRYDKGKMFNIPRHPVRASNIAACYLIDNMSYVFGKDERTPDRGPVKQKAFLELVSSAADETQGEGLRELLTFLQNPEECKRALAAFEAQEGSPADLMAFRYKGAFVHESPEARAFWAKQRAADAGCEKGVNCLVTGEPCVPVEMHPKLKNVPGGGTTGISLISFNSDAFESYGLSRCENAPLSRAASEGFSAALNRLLDRQPVDLKTGESLSVLNKRLSDDTVALFWTREKTEFTDIFQLLLDGDEEKVKAVFAAPWKGKRPPLEDTSPFFAIVLSGAQGRATLRRWHTSTIAETCKNLKQYFDDLEIVGQDHLPQIFALLSAISAPGKNKNIPPQFAENIFESAISGARFSRAILGAALLRIRAEGEITRPRAALVKACLCRELRRPDSDLKRKHPELMEVTKTMDPNCTNTAYRLGRLFAVLERTQASAIGDPNATITRRFYSAASTRPALVFGSLLSLARHHLEKTDYAPRYEKLIEEILAPLSPDNAFPRVLNVEEQALFALGFYHQKQSLFTKQNKTDNNA